MPAYEAVLHAVSTGQIRLARIDQSVVRLLNLKWKLGLAQNPCTNPQLVGRTVGTPWHHAVASHTARVSITLLRNDHHVLPLAHHRGTKVLLTGYSTSGFPVLQTMEKEFTTRGHDPTVVSTGGRCPTAGDIATAARSFLTISPSRFAQDGTLPRSDDRTCQPQPTGKPPS